MLFCLVHGTASRRLKGSGIHYISRFVGALAPVTCSGVSQMTWHRYYSPRCQCLFHRVDNNQKCCWCHSVNRPEKCWLTVQIRTVTVWWRWSMSYGAEQKKWSGRTRQKIAGAGAGVAENDGMKAERGAGITEIGWSAEWLLPLQCSVTVFYLHSSSIRSSVTCISLAYTAPWHWSV